MNKSAGVLLGIVVVAGALHTAGAWYTGTQLEGVLQSEIGQANAQLKKALAGTDAALNIELISVERHLYTSTARYRLTFQGTEVGSEGAELLVVENIEHGPLPLSRVKSLKLLPVLAASEYRLENNPLTEKWFAATNGASPLKGQLTMGYDRSVDGTLELLPLDITPDKNLALKFSGLNLTLSASDNAEKINLGGYVDSFKLMVTSPEQAPVTVELNGLTLASDLKKSPFDFYLGGSVLELKDSKVTFGNKQSVLTIKHFEQKDLLEAKGDTLSASLGYNVGEITYDGKPVGSAQMMWTLKNLDIPAMQSLGEFYQARLQPEQQAAAARGEMPQLNLSEAEQALVKADISKLLAAKPQIALENLSFKTANGESRFSLAVDLTNPASFDLTPDELTKQLIAQVQAKLRVSKPMIGDLAGLQATLEGQTDPQVIAQQAAMMSEMASGMALSTQLAQLEGNDLVSNLHYADNQVEFNGQKMSLEQFVALVMSKMGGVGG